ncbi:MAG: efflux RND transporter permease subunit [Bdellovibrionales bacterium]
MQSIVRFFAKEHLLGNLLTFIIIGFGLFAMISMPREVFPPVDFEITSVAAVLPGASPEQVEKLLVSPIEDALREIDGIKDIFSTSAESTGVVIIQLDPDTKDPDKINTDIKDAIDAITEFPDEVEDPIVTVADTSKSPVIQVNVSGSLPPLEMRKVTKYVRDELIDVEGVANVAKNGFLEREFYIEASPKKLAERRVSITDLVTAIARNNISLPGGGIKTIGGAEVLIKTDNELNSIEKIMDTPLVVNDEGSIIRIKDVAKVRERLEEATELYRANTKASVNLIVAKKPNADAIDMVDLVKEKVIELQANVPEGVFIGTANDFSVFVRNRISVLGNNLLIGLVLVLLVLTALLPFRVSLVVAMGIPVAVFATIITLKMFGISINLISMIGMIIVLGMIVDDAIVVCENVWRYYEKGIEPIKAVVKGVVEVIPPVTYSIMTTMVAFAPLAYMSGIMGKFIFQIPIVVIIALFFSLLEAAIIMPSHFASWVRVPKKSENGAFEQKAKWFNGIQQKYSQYVSWALKNRYKVLALMVVGVIASGFIIAKSARVILFPAEGIESFVIKIEAPKYFSLENTAKYVEIIEKEARKIPKTEITDIISMIGISRMDSNDPLSKRGSNYAQIQLILTPEAKRSRAAQEIVEELESKVELDRDDIITNFTLLKGGPPQGRPISIDILGEDFDEIYEASKLVQENIAGLANVFDVQNSFVPGKDQYTIRPISQRVTEAGLSAQEIATTVRASFDGIIASRVRELDDEIDIRVALTEATQPDVKETLSGIKIGNPLGNLIPLDQIAEFEKESTIAAIFHKNHKRMINVSADLDTKLTSSREKVAELKPVLAEFAEKYPNLKFQVGGENDDTKESMEGLVRSFIIAFVGIWALLILAFKKILQPTIILFAIPMGVIGVIYALLLHGKAISFMATLGIVALSGVIVNNAIVLLTFINREREQGENRYQSIINAATTRLRPVFMTTLTTVSGLLPTAYGIGGSDPFIIPLALALGWGLALGSFFISLFFPVMISIQDDLFELIDRILGRKKNSEPSQ